MQKELQFLEEQDSSPTRAHRAGGSIPAGVSGGRGSIAETVISAPKIPFLWERDPGDGHGSAAPRDRTCCCTGGKATGKNILAENLAWMFGRPSYNISFNVNTDSSSLIGTDTFRNNEVELRKGSVYRCAEEGGFGIFDEINMAKNDAASVLHATLDYRRMIDVPGYETD